MVELRSDVAPAGALGGLPFQQMTAADPCGDRSRARSRPPKAKPDAAGRRSLPPRGPVHRRRPAIRERSPGCAGASRSSNGAKAGMAIASPTTRLQTPGAADISQPKSRSSMRRAGHQAAPQIVENPPPIHQRQRIAFRGRPCAAAPAEDPRRDLPIAANPTMLALAVS